MRGKGSTLTGPILQTKALEFNLLENGVGQVGQQVLDGSLERLNLLENGVGQVGQQVLDGSLERQCKTTMKKNSQLTTKM
ncbi:hypothetical protein QE152_g16020 [Popillia japonica]|uniref:Uncharacterized protein n=1 Tax=Popillia japonica TaxID=7064 RepID=A0AAW1L410_POPJA